MQKNIRDKAKNIRNKAGIITDQKFLRSAFGRKYLPYIFARLKGRKGPPLGLSVGVLRKHMSISDQMRLLPKNSIVIASYFTLHESRNEKLPYCKKIKLVCSPFNHNSKSHKKKVKHISLCESDMVDQCWVNARKYKGRKKYDMLIITEMSKKGLRCKGVQMLKFLPDIEKEFGFKVCIMDMAKKSLRKRDRASPSLGEYLRDIASIVKHHKKRKLMRPLPNILNQKQMNVLMQSSRCLLCGNTQDASPKTITEALIRGIPVILNKNIFGGRKYIKENNGALFDGPNNVEQLYENYDFYKENLFNAIEKVFSNPIVREDIIHGYYDNWGLKKTSEKLAYYINKAWGAKIESAFYPQFKSHFKK